MLASQRGLKRWLVPPLLLTSLLLIVSLWWVFSTVNGLKEANVPSRFEFADFDGNGYEDVFYSRHGTIRPPCPGPTAM